MGKVMNGGMNELALFAGAGGGILGGHLLGWRTVCAVEREPYAAGVLVARQNDGSLPPFPIWDDVRTFDGRPWRGRVDVVSGGFPCQDISIAGKGAGLDGERSGLWREMARIIREVRPRHVLVENSPMLTSRGLGRVLADLAEMGFDAEWGVLGADDAGAPHIRKRIWIVGTNANVWHGVARSVDPGSERSRDATFHEQKRSTINFGDRGAVQVADAYSKHDALRGDATSIASEVACWGSEPGRSSGNRQARCSTSSRQSEVVADAYSTQRERGRIPIGARTGYSDALRTGWWAAEPDVGRVAHGVASRVDRLRALGNGQVPAVVRLAWRELVARRR